MGAGGMWEFALNSTVCAVSGLESEILSYVSTSGLGSFHSDFLPEICDVEYVVEVGGVFAAGGIFDEHSIDEDSNRLRFLFSNGIVMSDLVADAGFVGTS